MNNLSSYCGLVDAKIRASDKDLPVQSEMGVSRLMDVLVDAREVLRNDALLLLIQLTKGHANLQKIVAFENAFDKLCDIMETVSIFFLKNLSFDSYYCETKISF